MDIGIKKLQVILKKNQRSEYQGDVDRIKDLNPNIFS